MHIFQRANTALQHDLAAYARALRTIVESLPEARRICEQILKETRLIQALLAFGSGPQVVELNQIAFYLGNLWPFRENGFERTLGFQDEIQEARQLREQARRGLKVIERHNDGALSGELETCLRNIIVLFDEEERLLQECHDLIHPYATGLDMTRKRLHLLVAAAEARMPETPERTHVVHIYSQAATLLNDWESGVPLDQRGVNLLENCLEMLEQVELFNEGLLTPASST